VSDSDARAGDFGLQSCLEPGSDAPAVELPAINYVDDGAGILCAGDAVAV
jgi:hypothetical protein